MLKVNYCSRGVVCSDFEGKETVDSFVSSYLKSAHKDIVVYETANELVFSYFVLKAMEGILSSEDVSFYYQDILLKFDDRYGINTEVNGKIIEVGFSFDVNCSIITVGIDNIRKRNTVTVSNDAE